MISRSKHTSAKSSVTKEIATVTPLSRFTSHISNFLGSEDAGMRRATAILSAVGLVAVVLGSSSIATPAQADPYVIESFSSRTTDEAEANDTAAGGHPFQNQTAFEFSSHLSPDGNNVFPERTQRLRRHA